MTIIAPSGKLDVSIISSPPSSVGSPSSPTFNPNKLLPIIYDMKEGSVLQGRAQVGDRKLDIDEVNCKHMTTEAVTDLIRQRKGNDFRTFVLVRENLDELDVPWLDSST